MYNYPEQAVLCWRTARKEGSSLYLIYCCTAFLWYLCLVIQSSLLVLVRKCHRAASGYSSSTAYSSIQQAEVVSLIILCLSCIVLLRILLIECLMLLCSVEEGVYQHTLTPQQQRKSNATSACPTTSPQRVFLRSVATSMEAAATRTELTIACATIHCCCGRFQYISSVNHPNSKSYTAVRRSHTSTRIQQAVVATRRDFSSKEKHYYSSITTYFFFCSRPTTPAATHHHPQTTHSAYKKTISHSRVCTK